MEEKSRAQELSVREISLIRELAQIRKEHKRDVYKRQVQAPCDERVPETPAEIPHGFVPPRISASGRFTVTIQNGCDRSGVLGTAAAG